MRPDQLTELCPPNEPLERTLAAVSKAMEEEPFLDVQLAELLLGRARHAPLDQVRALRILEVLDRVSTGIRLARMIGQLLGHADPLIRSKAALVAGRRMKGFRWIHAHLLAAEPRVRANMIEALWENPDPECLKVFAQYRHDEDSRVAGNALYGLYLCGAPDAIPSIVQMASHPVPRFRATAAWLMGKIGRPEFADTLRRMLEGESRMVRGRVLKSLVLLNQAAGSAPEPAPLLAAARASTEPRGPAPGEYFVTWKPEYSVGIEAIDRQHQGLVAIIRELQEAMWAGRGREFLGTVIDRLVKYTDGHLSFEEKMLATQGYESLAEHSELHRVLAGQVYELREKIRAGGAVSNAAVMLFLRNWLTDHIMQHDQKYAQALRITA